MVYNLQDAILLSFSFQRQKTVSTLYFIDKETPTVESSGLTIGGYIRLPVDYCVAQLIRRVRDYSG